MRQKNQQQTQWYTHWRAFLSLLLLSCVSSFAHASNRAIEAWEWIEQGALVVDVRTPAEFQQKHIEGAVNIPLNELAKGFSKIDKSQPIVSVLPQWQSFRPSVRFPLSIWLHIAVKWRGH